jgi:YggT family protein
MIGEIILGLGGIVISLINVYIWVIIIASLLTFVNPDPYNPIVQFLYRITEPAYAMVRRFMPTTVGGLDFAPLVIIIVLQVFIVILSSVMHNIAY